MLLFVRMAFPQGISGSWKGKISAGGHLVPIIFHFNADSPGTWSGKWDSPDQNALNLPFSSIEVKGDSVLLGIKMITGSYNGRLVGNDSIAGMWHQGNAFLPLNFSRFTDTTSRPVKKPFPHEKQVAVTASDGVRLFGTLLSKTPGQKLVVIIAGSGPTDREGNNPAGSAADSYEMLAHSLDSQNVATFRFDKRGIAESMPADFSESNLVFDNYINDVKSICTFLRDSLKFEDIYLAGHSEGSLIGMVAAQTLPVKGYISIAGAGRPIDQVVEQQVNQQPIADSLKKEITLIFNELREGQTVASVPSSLKMLFRKSLQPYMMSWLKYDPAAEIKKLRCPVLILQGTCDKQVTVTDAENLHHASLASKWDLIPRMTHTLKDTDEGCTDPNNKTYVDPSLPINRQLVKDIVLFVGK